MGYPRKVFEKDPAARKDYQVNWSAWLAGDTIATSSWTVADGLDHDTESNTTTLATIWLEGGTLGQRYLVTNSITTVGGRSEDATFLVHVKES